MLNQIINEYAEKENEFRNFEQTTRLQLNKFGFYIGNFYEMENVIHSGYKCIQLRNKNNQPLKERIVFTILLNPTNIYINYIYPAHYTMFDKLGRKINCDYTEILANDFSKLLETNPTPKELKNWYESLDIYDY